MKQQNYIIIGLLILIIGFGGGYLAHSAQAPATAINGHMMNNIGGMDSAMDDMMEGLSGKTGDEFDKAFLSEMIVHHEGAVEMAQAALQNAKHQEIKNLANAIISAQTTEIVQMKAWQKSWYNQ